MAQATERIGRDLWHWSPAPSRAEGATQITSPGLRGEVGISRIKARIPAEGRRFRKEAPHPNVLPASGAREPWWLNGCLLLIRAGSLIRDPVDLGLGLRIVAQKAVKIRSTQNQHPAIAEGDDGGFAAAAASQAPFAQ